MIERMLTPSEVAARWGVDNDKVLRLIHSGQLKAINTAKNPGGRPRWRISPEWVELFERGRMNRPPQPKPRRRRQAAANLKEFF
jgi:excisionase family DNA binding protein